MFNFVSKQLDEDQSDSLLDVADSSSTITSLPDAPSSFEDVSAPTQRNGVNERCYGKQADASGVGLSDERVLRHQRTFLELVDRLRSHV